VSTNKRTRKIIIRYLVWIKRLVKLKLRKRIEN